MQILKTWIFFALLFAGSAARAQETELQVELLTAMGTENSRKGDAVSARVISPEALRGDIAKGKITNLQTGNKLRGKSVLSFTFETLEHAGQAVPIASRITSIFNSKGQMDADEEGRVIQNSNNLGKAAAGAGVGALVGGILGGGKGAAIGAGAGALISIVMIDIAAEGPSIRLAPGSRIILMAQSRSGPALAGLSANPASPASTPAAAQPAPATQAAPPASSGQPNLTEVKSDFVPGEKAFFFDDFSDMAGDEPPPHWKVRGGSVALKTGVGIRQLTIKGERVTLTPNIKALPKNFTMETEIKMDDPQDSRLVWYLHDKSWDGPNGPNAALSIWTAAGETELRLQVRYNGESGLEDLASTSAKIDFGQPYKLAAWIQNGRLRVYVNAQRIVDVNQVELPALTGADLYAEFAENKAGLRMARFAESTPDFSQIISSAGRYVTHGIFFDTDSDRLKPESAPVMKLVAQGLEKNPNLKLAIEGHTDATGDAAHNMDLSKRRAEAVKSVLVSQFGISADRLTTTGLGSSKPIDSNDTPSGRAQNRRVEFVKL